MMIFWSSTTLGGHMDVFLSFQQLDKEQRSVCTAFSYGLHYFTTYTIGKASSHFHIGAFSSKTRKHNIVKLRPKQFSKVILTPLHRPRNLFKNQITLMVRFVCQHISHSIYESWCSKWFLKTFFGSEKNAFLKISKEYSRKSAHIVIAAVFTTVVIYWYST